ncbi:MAG: cytochrome c3 family protein [bacterium]
MRYSGMLIFMLIMIFVVGGFSTVTSQEETQPAEGNSCISCHLEMGDELAAPVEGMKEDVHTQQGLSCADCHGGDPEAGFDGDSEAAMNPDKGYIGVPDRTEIPKFCARCHQDPQYMRKFNPRVSTDQLARYKTSVHGRRLKKGDTKVATCTDCHGVHGIRNAKDSRSSVYPLNIPDTCGKCHADAEYMQDYGIPSDQIAAYKKSVHGVALLEKGDQAAPACNDCHGNHGASPPGAPSIAFICGQCHLNNSELFLKSPHRAAFEELELPECETCHGNHEILHPTEAMIGTGEESICLDCHEEDSKGYVTAYAIRQQIDNLKTKIYYADSLVTKAERAGMQVSEALFQLKDADDALIKARTIVHSLSVSKTEEVTNQGLKLVEQALHAGRTALNELQFRRKGLAFSIVFILILAIGLYMKIKDLDKEHPVRDLT